MYSKLWKFYGTHWLLFTTSFRGKIVIISAWLRRNIAIALCSRRVASFLCKKRASKWFTICFLVFCIRYFRRRFRSKALVQPPVRTYTHKFILSAPLFRLLHFSRPPLLTSSCYLSLAAYSPGKNILGQEWDLWIGRAKSWVVFMVRVLLPHFGAHRVTMYLCQRCM